MDQQTISRETVARLRAERAAVTDPAVVAGLDDQIRLHTELAGPDAPDPEPTASAKPAKAAKAPTEG